MAVAVAVAVAAASCTGSVSADKTMTAFGMTFTITDVVVSEGGTAEFTITGSGTNTENSDKTLTITAASGGAAGVDPATSPGDYGNLSLTSATIQKKKPPFKTPNATSFTVTVPTVGDTLLEPKEDFKVTLAMAGIADTAVGYASVCNVPSGFSVDDPVAVVEGNNVIFTVTRAGPTTSAATVQYATVDDTARAGSDFTAKTGTLNFPVGSSSQTVTVATLADGDSTGPETFTLRLSNASGSNLIIDEDGTGTIEEPPPVCESNEIGANQAHKYQGAELYFEMFRYLTGGPVKSGHWGDNDYTGPANKNLDEECYLPGLESLDPDGGVDAVLAWDTGNRPTTVTGGEADPYVEQNGFYVSPLGEDSQCAGTYAINMLFGVSQQDNDFNSDINAARSRVAPARRPRAARRRPTATPSPT
ncbi:MAG: hypothetical protein IPF57_03760 [Gammaproteobacteria bacterium]|nr:hypothetical protein [Gammaproteobacteria bacterium]